MSRLFGWDRFRRRALFLRAGAFLLVLLPLLHPAIARAADLAIRPGDQVVRVAVRTPAQLAALEAMDLDVWSHDLGIGPVDVHVSAENLRALAAAGFDFVVLNKDLHAAYLAERAALGGAGPGGPPGAYFSAYHPLPSLVDFLHALVEHRPDLASMVVMGHSLEGRPIWAFRLTGPGYTPSRPALLYHGAIHAREWITSTVIPFLAHYLVSNYDSDPDVARLVNEVEWWLVPVLNPDGFEYSWIDATTRMWRKNRRPNVDGSYGVDLNRNFGHQWGGLGSSGNPPSETYRGTAPFSEPETQVLRDFTVAHPNIRAHVDIHSYGQLVMWPWGYTIDLCPDDAIFRDLGVELGDLILGVHGRTYDIGPIYTAIYPVSGGTVDWFYGNRAIWSYTYELRDNGQYGFLLPADQIIPTNEEMLPTFLRIADWISQPLLIDFPNGVPAHVPAGAPFPLDVRIIPIGQPQPPAGASLFHRVGVTGPFTQTPLVHVSGDLYRALLPAVVCGDFLQFYVQANVPAGPSILAPPEGAAGPFSALSYVNVFSDDFESHLGWIAGVPGDTATAGIWVRGDPNGTSAQPEHDHTPAGVNCFFTGQNDIFGQDNNVDNGKTTLVSPLLALPAFGDVRIGYWRWYFNAAGPAPGQDVFQVDITNNNGQSWIGVETVGPTGPGTVGGWTYHEFSVGDFVAPTASVRLRFVASDYGAPSVVEAAVDDVVVRQVNCGASSCPSDLGDLDLDGDIDGADIAPFVSAMLAPPHYHPCADLAPPFGVEIDPADVSAFVAVLLQP